MQICPSRLRGRACALALVLAGAGACAPPGAAPAGDARISPEYDKGRLTRLILDRDENGKPDTWGYMDGARVMRVEVDENGDGAIDRWEYYSGSGLEAQGSGGTTQDSGALQGAGTVPGVERIERATRHDGKITRREFFERGVLTRIEEDTDADGTLDKWETYVNGELSVLALDTRHRGTADRRLVYGTDGSLLRIEADPDGTGQFTPIQP